MAQRQRIIAQPENQQMVEALLGRLDRWLAGNRPDYYAHLRPGVTDRCVPARCDDRRDE